jgi:hypothetical protein
VKLVALWLAIVGFAVIAAGGCSISHRSDDFACTKQSDCINGRTCTDGFCVAPQLDSGVPSDGRPGGDAASCPSQCTSCNTTTKTCTVDCALNGTACNQQVTCPVGWSCNIACSTPNSCRNGINCVNSKSCTITCSGKQSCQNVSCGAGPCKIDCSGNSSCNNVNCGQSCACDVTCQVNSLCSNLTCKAPPNCNSQLPLRGCTSLLLPICNTCQ